MRTLEIPSPSAQLGVTAPDASQEVVVFTVNGRPIAALVPLENVDMETVTLGTTQQFLSSFERSCHRQEKEGGISGADMRRRLWSSPQPGGSVPRSCWRLVPRRCGSETSSTSGQSIPLT